MGKCHDLAVAPDNICNTGKTFVESCIETILQKRSYSV